MRRKWIAIGCLICMTLMVCSGCGNVNQETTAQESSTHDNIEESTRAEETTVEMTREETMNHEETREEQSLPLTPGIDKDKPAGKEILFEKAGKERIEYTTDRNSVVCITSAEMLSGYDVEALQQYDEAFFETNALVLIYNTVGSGSIQIEIDAMIRDGNEISVVLSHRMPGDAGTMDMATWLLWAEVDKDLAECQWGLHGVKQDSQVQTH